MSESINRLNMEYKILKRNIKKTKENLQEEYYKSQLNENIENMFSILDCNIDQTTKLFKLARNDGEVQVMKDIIKNNFKRERLMIQKLAIKIYRVTRSKAIEIIYNMWRSSIDEELKFLHFDYEDLVKTCTTKELTTNSDYNRVVELFSDHQKQKNMYHELFMESKAYNNVDDMNRMIDNDIPQELKTVKQIKDIISRLYNEN